MQTDMPPKTALTPGEALPPALPQAHPAAGRPWVGFFVDILITVVMLLLVTFIGMAAWGVLRAVQLAAGLRPGMVPDIDQLASALQAAANSALGRPGARVLLGTVMAV